MIAVVREAILTHTVLRNDGDFIEENHENWYRGMVNTFARSSDPRIHDVFGTYENNSDQETMNSVWAE